MEVRRSLLVVSILAVALIAGAIAQEKPWFDMDKCAFCKQLVKYDGLVENMKSEYHHISNGILSITVVDDKYNDAYNQAQADMERVAAEMGKGGEFPYMCGHCSKYGYFMMSGVKMEAVEADAGIILIMQSDDTTMVKELHAFADKSEAEMEKLLAKQSEK